MFKEFKRTLINKLSLFLRMILKRDKYDYLVGVAIFCYGIIFSYFTLLKHYNFYSYAADLGVFVQSFYTTLFEGKLFYYTPELFINPAGSYFGIHFSPILFILLPIYALYPSAESLLVTQSFLMAMGGVPLYLISQKVLNSKKIAFAMVIVYLLYVPLHGANWFDFHPQAFIPIMVFFIYYFAIKQAWTPYFIATLLGLMIQEHLVFIIFLMAAYFFCGNYLKNILLFVKQKQPLKREALRLLREKIVLVSILTMIMCFGWYLLILQVKSYFPINPLFLDIYRAKSTFEVLGFNDDIIKLPLYVLSNPVKVFNALRFDFYIKFVYILILYTPVLFTPIKSKFCFVSFFVLGSMLLTNYVPYYTVGAQYPLYLVPLVFISAVDGLSSFLKNEPSKTKKNRNSNKHKHLTVTSTKALNTMMKLMIVTSMIFVIGASPLSPFSQSFSEKGILWYPSYSSVTGQNFVDSLHSMLKLIPPKSSIMTINYIFPHVASRLDAYLVPFDFPGYQQEDRKNFLKNYIIQILDKTEYVLLDSKATDYWSKFVFQTVLNNSFGIYATTYSFVLFKKNFEGEPILFPNGDYQVYMAYKDHVVLCGKIITDPTSKSKLVAFSKKGINEGLLAYGPYVCLPPGKYNIIFEVKISQPNEGIIAKFDVVDEYGKVMLVEKDLYSFEVEAEKWMNVTLQLSTSKLLSSAEFRVFSNGIADIYFDRVIIEKSKT